MSFAGIFRGARDLMQPPIDNIDDYWSPQEKDQASQMLACSVVGGPETIRRGIRNMIDRTNADELMIVSDIFDPKKRLRSFEIIADAGLSVFR
jgi:alkanesulfonate monooxygenase SsuD/methylene tetrahydromethanopterin reductase-like flavin-dependent oxidoreductase (luciferase family)